MKAFSHAIDLTKHLNIEIIGAILNQVDFRFWTTYYNTYRYYKPYNYYGGYYYKNQYYEYSDGEAGEKTNTADSPDANRS
ncbi:MAG: hypothetical protein RAP03_20710 [Candidatus Electryonea clarkiae]|nr:hypothetical protein [Candidatus Electryonea clarkiae]